ncbi:MAG TPA: amidohydrolase family protein [Acetobacteraceae bacterium]|nr:amidohydrolase family protein [Acetobacteraceae bacterium]
MTEMWNSYGPTAARRHGRPGREMRPKGITIDIHAHVAVPEAAAFVRPHLDLSTIPLAHFATPETQALNRKQDEDRVAVATTPEPRLAELDAMGIDLQVVKPPPPQCYFTLPVEIAVPATRMVNEGIAAFVAKRPDRFIGLGTVPLQDGREAARELGRCMGELGFKGVQILTNVHGRELSDPEYAPFWAEAERLGALVVIHPNGFTEGERLRRHYFNNVVGNPFETTLALHYLIFDGVLERYPRLKILAVHGGGYLGAYSGRIDHAWGARSDSRGTLPRPPGEYLQRVFFDTIVFTPHQLEYLVKVFGAGQVTMGTDYWFDMGEYDPIGHIRSVEGFDETTVAALAGGNAQRLLNL